MVLLYLAATCVSCFFSSHATIRRFELLALLLFAVVYQFYAVALFSVGCVFAALLSAILFVHFKFGRHQQCQTEGRGCGGACCCSGNSMIGQVRAAVGLGTPSHPCTEPRHAER